MILSTVFLRGEFKLENIYSGVNYFLREKIMFVVNLRDVILADYWKNRKTRKIFVPHGITFKLGK